MSTCKDCLHYEVCQYHITEETDMTINECSHGFKNKADYIEVVRCKDCVYFYAEKQDEDFPYFCLHHSGPMGTAPNHFCNYGKRKERKIMREILFRGKRIDNNQWIEGTLIATTAVQTKYYIVDSCWCESQRITEKGCADFNWIEAYEVIPETIGQYIGLTENGTKIFEGDIVVVNIKGYNTICKVAWADNVAQFQLWQTNTIPNTSTALNLGNYDCEVIGNIHDNRLEDFKDEK